MEWCARHGTLGTHHRVVVETTARSVAGRGLFACDNNHNHTFKRGGVLAYIPARCVFTTANPQVPLLDDVIISEEDKKESRHAILAACAFLATKQLSNNSDDTSLADWAEWIRTWQGPPAIRPLEDFDASELKELADLVQTNTTVIQDAIQLQYQIFQSQQWILFQHAEADPEETNRLATASKLYSIVLSRSANLGPDWKYQAGVIPLHDMLNHPPSGGSASVELMSMGEIARLTSEAYRQELLKSAFGWDNLPPIQERDLVLVASRPIEAGEELFLSYNGGGGGGCRSIDPRKRAWKMLQYGFPLS